MIQFAFLTHYLHCSKEKWRVEEEEESQEIIQGVFALFPGRDIKDLD